MDIRYGQYMANNPALKGIKDPEHQTVHVSLKWIKDPEHHTHTVSSELPLPQQLRAAFKAGAAHGDGA
jgi:hypothetical protein